MNENTQDRPKRAGNRGLGRKRGSKNKRPRVIQEMVLQALDNVGGVEYLTRQAEENPKAFLALVAKLLPTRVEGDDENPVSVIHTITRRIIDPRRMDAADDAADTAGAPADEERAA